MTAASADLFFKSGVVAVGNTGSGKSAAVRSMIVERALDRGLRTIIIDPTGVWWGLRFKADGSKGYCIRIFGGQHGDCELTDVDGDAIGRFCTRDATPAIIDVSDMGMNERKRFALDFFTTLYDENRAPVQLIIDEADEFAPQNPMPDQRRLLNVVDRIVRRGRVKGFRVTLVTQRPAVLHKNVMSQANVLFALRLTAPQDRAAVKAWIDGQADATKGREVLTSFPKLQRGDCWVWAPGDEYLERLRVPMFETFDSSRTPGDGETVVAPPGPMPYAHALRLSFSGTGAAPATKQVELPRHKAPPVKEKPAMAPPPTPKHAPAADRSLIAHQQIVGNLVQELRLALADCRRIADEIENQMAHRGRHENQNLPPAPADEVIAEPAPAPVKRSPTARQTEARRGPADGLLDGLLFLRHIGYSDITWRNACIIAGVIHGNGYFYGGARALQNEGLVRVTGDRVEITLGETIPGPPQTFRGIIHQWAEKLQAPSGAMLRFLEKQPSQALSPPELAAGIGAASTANGYWYGGLKRLRTAYLLEDRSDGRLRLANVLRYLHDGDTLAGVYKKGGRA